MPGPVRIPPLTVAGEPVVFEQKLYREFQAELEKQPSAPPKMPWELRTSPPENFPPR